MTDPRVVSVACTKSCPGEVRIDLSQDAAKCDSCGTVFVFREPVTPDTRRLMERADLTASEAGL